MGGIRAHDYAKKIVGRKGDEVMYHKDAVGLSFHWVKKAGVETQVDAKPPRLPRVIHIWEDERGIVVKTEVKNIKGV